MSLDVDIDHTRGGFHIGSIFSTTHWESGLPFVAAGSSW